MTEKKEHRKDMDFILRSSGSAGAGKLVDILVRYVTSVALTRILGAKVMGVFVLGRAVVWIVATISQLGMGLGAVRQIAFFTARNETNKVGQTIRLSLLVCGIISTFAAIILFFTGDFIALVLFKKPELAQPLKFLIFSIPLISLSFIFLDILRGLKKINQRVAIENYFLPLSNLLMIAVFYLLGFRLEGVIAAFLLSNFFSLAALGLIHRKRLKMSARSRLQKAVTLNFFKFSMPLMFVKILGELKIRGDILLLGLLSTTSNVGIFFIAYRLAAVISIPWQAANMIVAPMVSGYFAQGDIKSIEYNYKNITKLIFITGMFFWGFLFIFSTELLSIFGEEFKNGSTVVLLVCLGQVLKTLVGHAGPMLAMIGKPSLNLVTTLIALISMAILNVVLIPRFGIIGAGVANLAGMTIACFLELYFLYRFLKIHPFRMDFIKPVIAALVSGGIICPLKTVLPVNIFSTLFLMTAFVLLYYVSLYLQKFSEEEMALLGKMNKLIADKGITR